jgi:hypothetical protein
MRFPINLHKRMRESHFTSIYDAIPYAFYQCKDVVVLGIQHDLLKRSLLKRQSAL